MELAELNARWQAFNAEVLIGRGVRSCANGCQCAEDNFCGKLYSPADYVEGAPRSAGDVKSQQAKTDDASAGAAIQTCKGYTASGCGNTSLCGCYAAAGSYGGEPLFVLNDRAALFRWTPPGGANSSKQWRFGSLVDQQLKTPYYTTMCVRESPVKGGWVGWENQKQGTPPTLASGGSAYLLSPDCPAPGPPPGPGRKACTGTMDDAYDYVSAGFLKGSSGATMGAASFQPTVGPPVKLNCSNCRLKNGSLCPEGASDWGAELTTAGCFPDFRSVAPDMVRPRMLKDVPPTASLRVRAVTRGYEHTRVYHALYLPKGWSAEEKKKKWPIIVEYSGNGPWRASPGGPGAIPDISTGRPEDQNLGFGLSNGGQEYIWISMPLLTANLSSRTDISTYWWGCNSTQAFVKPCGTYDVEPTLDYTKRTIRDAISSYGGDASAVFATGWSRGAIACGYIAAHDDEIAALFTGGFVPFSHIDGEIGWPYPGSDVNSALAR
jgi:hypothetical protein